MKYLNFRTASVINNLCSTALSAIEFQKISLPLSIRTASDPVEHKPNDEQHYRDYLIQKLGITK